MFENKYGTRLQELIAIILIAGILLRQSDAVPAGAATTTLNVTKYDFKTEFSKQIIRRSKAADIKVTLNTKVEPCDDFYQFACGNWQRHNPAQLLTHIMTDKFQMLAKAFDRRLERMLNEPTSDTNNMDLKVSDYYKACLAVKQDEVAYRLSLENVYKEYGERFPILAGEDWNETNFNWWDTVARIANKYGKPIILAVDIMGDIMNNTENRIYVGPPDYTQSTSSKLFSVLQEAETVKHLQKYFSVEHTYAKKTAKEMIEFERALVQGGTDARLGLGLVEMLKLKNITDLTPNMQRYVTLVLGEKLPESIYIYDENYLDNMAKIVADTPKRTLTNYILWQLLQDYIVDADSNDLPKWCIDKTKKLFGKYIDYLVYQRYKNEETEKEVYEVWEQIRETFREELKGDKLDWIANDTREFAVEKLDAMELHINSYESENFTETFGNLSMDRQHYVANIQQILQQENKQKLQKQHEPSSGVEATEVLSFTPVYNILENNIKIPVALMQPHYFWDANYPQALKYASLGYLIAHEMVHGFDDEGRNYDKRGNFKNLWDLKSTYEFDARRKCFQAQYHNYKYGGRHLPESVSQSENIADNAGVKLAYATYMRWLRTQKVTDADIEQKETLPGLPFNNHQLFFVSFAQVWCEDVQSLFKSSVASSDTHAPGMFRVIGSLSNFQEFSWVFKCKPDAPMDPEFKCAIY